MNSVGTVWTAWKPSSKAHRRWDELIPPQAASTENGSKIVLIVEHRFLIPNFILPVFVYYSFIVIVFT